MSDKLELYGIAFMALVGAFAISFAFAEFKEPQAYWLWHTILGVL